MGIFTRVRFIYLKWWIFPKHTKAITLYPFVFYRDQEENGCISPVTRAHEMAHVLQVRRMGWLRFYFSYLVESRRHGYRNNKYEVEARNAEHAHGGTNTASR